MRNFLQACVPLLGLVILVAMLALCMSGPVVAQYTTKVVRDQGGDRMNILEGGSIAYEGNDFNVARGVLSSVTGAQVIDTGLTTVASCSIALATIGASAGDAAVFEAAADGGNVNLTILQDDFATESANATDVFWIAVGS